MRFRQVSGKRKDHTENRGVIRVISPPADVAEVPGRRVNGAALASSLVDERACQRRIAPVGSDNLAHLANLSRDT